MDPTPPPTKQHQPIDETHFTYHSPNPEDDINYPHGKAVTVNNETVKVTGSRIASPQGWQYVVATQDGRLKVVRASEINPNASTTQTKATTDRVHLNKIYRDIAKENFDEIQQQHNAKSTTYIENYITKTVESPSSNILQIYKAKLKAQMQKEMDTFYLDCKRDMNTHLKEFTADLEREKSKHKLEMATLRSEHKKELETTIETLSTKLQDDMKKFIHDQKSATATSRDHSTTSKSSPPYTKSTPPYKPYTTSSYATDHVDTPTKISIYDKRHVEYQWQGETYLQEDKDFIKNTPSIVPPATDDDGLTLYSQIQRNARLYNILVTEIADIKPWDMAAGSNPPTYVIPADHPEFNAIAYQRGATAVYTKLQQVNCSKVPVFKQFIEYEQKSQDGFRALYAILTICHPNLVDRSKMTLPSLVTTPNIFTYIRQLRNWHTFEQIQKRNYSELEQLTTAMEEMERDGRFDKALQLLRMKRQLHQNLLKTSPKVSFPPSLYLEQLPYTLMTAYNPEERDTLFGLESTGESTDDDSEGVVNKLSDGRWNNNKNFKNNYNFKKNQSSPNFTRYNRYSQNDNRRKRIDATCAACGCFGHDANKNGCDLTAQVLMILRYIKKEPQRIKSIINRYADHQEKRKKYIQKKGRFSDKFHQNANARNYQYGPQVRALFDLVGDTLDDIFEEDYGVVHQIEDDDTSDLVDLISTFEGASTDTFHDSQQDDGLEHTGASKFSIIAA